MNDYRNYSIVFWDKKCDRGVPNHLNMNTKNCQKVMCCMLQYNWDKGNDVSERAATCDKT